ncbi:class V chitinase 1 [Pyrenophora seminiperda CCB06]|uniref:chitinase n=1 Tax=Pyrenophora seminiperda CCB06 TaxID=1302712 RepID=A0A3M7M5X8_9PLEO|nr:class V chitinase 1 [Pyrenophora seminiperda CCB06]
MPAHVHHHAHTARDLGVQASVGSQYQAGVYFTNWAIYARNYTISNIPVEKITRVNYAFANLNETTGESSLKLVTDLGIDGLDTDWEYVQNESDGASLLDTMQICRQMFDDFSRNNTNGYHYELHISAPAGPQNYNKLNVAELDRYVDSWNLMAFDYQGGGFSNFTGHMSNVYASTSDPRTTNGWVNETKSFMPFNTKEAIDYYKSHVASPSKIQLGMPLYGRSFANVVDLSRGQGALGQRFNGSGEGSWEAGVLDYKVLPQNGTKVYTDRSVLASWSWDATKKQVVSFDTPEVARWKTDFLKTECLGGAWFWDASGDLPVSDPKSLVGTVVNALGGAESLRKNQNNLHYPTSKYYNIKNAVN